MSKDGTSKEGTATGGAGFTEAQLASIGEVVQGLLDKAPRKDPASGDGGGPSRGASTGETGELEARGRAGVRYGMSRRAGSAW